MQLDLAFCSILTHHTLFHRLHAIEHLHLIIKNNYRLQPIFATKKCRLLLKSNYKQHFSIVNDIVQLQNLIVNDNLFSSDLVHCFTKYFSIPSSNSFKVGSSQNNHALFSLQGSYFGNS